MTMLVRFALVFPAVLALAGLPAAAQSPAPAARPAAAMPPPVIAIVDMAQIQEQTSAMKSIKEQMQKEEVGLKGEVEKREKELHAADQDLQQQRTLLSADAFADRRRNFEQQVGDAQRYMAARKRQLDAGFGDGMHQVDVALNTVLREVATERGLTLILARQSTLLAANALDITEEVKARLDKRLPRVAIKLPPLDKK